MTLRAFNVLFLCTANSARSILAESVLCKDGVGRFNGYSDGNHPKGAVHLTALKLVAKMDYPTENLRSKSWNEFVVPGAPVMDFVFTVCDDAACGMYPVWPGQPITAHWGIGDPAAVEGVDWEHERTFVMAARYMEQRIADFTALPFAGLERASLTTKLRKIGHTEGASSPRSQFA